MKNTKKNRPAATAQGRDVPDSDQRKFVYWKEREQGFVSVGGHLYNNYHYMIHFFNTHRINLVIIEPTGLTNC